MNSQEIHKLIFSNKAAILTNLGIGINREIGQIEFLNVEEDKQVTSTMLKMITKLGKNVVTLNLVNFSLPCELFEPRSDVDRNIEFARILSSPLLKASKTADKIERIKLVSANLVGSGYLFLRAKKAMNPYLGETCQATLEDGTDLCCEQISHHPAITSFYFTGPQKAFVAYGSYCFVGNFRITHAILSLGFQMTIRFIDGHEIKVLRRPNIKITGIVQGSRKIFFKGCQEIIDVSEGTRSVIFFDIGEKKHIIGSSKTVSRDCVEGLVYSSTDISKPIDEKIRRISELKDIKKEIARMKGSWFERVDINEINYWHIDKHLPLKMIFHPNPLPSDWRFREDLLFIRRKDIPRADAWKEACEIRQRKDKTLREESKKK